MSDRDLPEIDPDRVVIRDKRRIDPETGQARRTPPDLSQQSTWEEPAVTQEPAAVPNELEAQLAERTADLQRLQAEFANYRRRVERDRDAVRELAIGSVLSALLPVLDDLDRARAHGDLTGPLKSVADQLDGPLSKLGLVAFGEPGDAFDPSVHEAVMHSESSDVEVPTATTVMRKGYRHGERLLRPAMVGVSEPVHVADSADDPEAGSDSGSTEPDAT